MHICEARIEHFVFCTGWLGGLSAQEFFYGFCILYPPAFFIQVGWTALWLGKCTLTALSELDRAEHRSSWSVGPWKPASEQYIGASWPANRTCLWNLLRAGKQGIKMGPMMYEQWANKACYSVSESQ